MFYCLNCKKSVDAPNCPTCGKVFTPSDEIVHCPSCNKMFFKPSRDFNCTKCGTLVQIQKPNAQPQQNNVAPHFPQNSVQNSNFAPPNPFANAQMPQQQNVMSTQNQIKPQPQIQPQMQQTQNQFEMPTNNNQNVTQNLNAQNMEQMVQPMSQSAVDSSNQNIAQSQNLNPIQDQGVQNNVQPNNQISPQTDFASLFGQNNLFNDQNQAGAVNFSELRAKEGTNTIQNQPAEDGKVYDENGYEVVDMSGGKKSKKKKKDKKSKDASSQPTSQDYFSNGSNKEEVEVVKSSKGIKIFAFVELFLLILSICAIVYLTLGQYIMTDPCQRTWRESENANNLMVTDTEYKEKEIVKALVSEDGKYAIYKVVGEGVNDVVVFEIEKGFSISTFFDMSTAKIFSFEESQEKAKALLPDVKWQENK